MRVVTSLNVGVGLMRPGPALRVSGGSRGNGTSLPPHGRVGPLRLLRWQRGGARRYGYASFLLEDSQSRAFKVLDCGVRVVGLGDKMEDLQAAD